MIITVVKNYCSHACYVLPDKLTLEYEAKTKCEFTRTPVRRVARANDMTTWAVVGMCHVWTLPCLSVVFGCATKHTLKTHWHIPDNRNHFCSHFPSVPALPAAFVIFFLHLFWKERVGILCTGFLQSVAQPAVSKLWRQQYTDPNHGNCP